MKTLVMQTEAVSKVYKSTRALHNVSLDLEEGRIYGLIGQNGAGKTTLMRIAAGLSFPTEGTIALFGRKDERQLQEMRKRIGCLIEQPGINLQMSAADNMKFHRLMKGIPNEEREIELLEYVGLKDTGKKKAKNFSLGMKQRLGIAIALLGTPQFLILDEPVNGLDPVGMVEIRNILKKLCEERGITILISSHNLPELYYTATDYIIIHQGEIRKTLTAEDLEACCEHHILIRTDDPGRLAAVLEGRLETDRFKVMPDKSIRLFDYLEDIETVARAIFEEHIMVTELSRQGVTLEEYFLSVVGGAQND